MSVTNGIATPTASTPTTSTPAGTGRYAAGQAVAEVPVRVTVGASRRAGLRTISREMRRSYPVFIVGEARSGSTILFHTLQKHPRFRPRQENLQESSFVVQAPHAAVFAERPPRNLRRFLLDDESAWDDFVDSLRALQPWLRLAERFGPNFAWQRWLGPGRLVARSFAYHAWHARGCQRLLEKTPDHVHHIEHLYDCFPRARMLYVHRHPVDVYSSYVRRGRVDPKADWARIGPEQFCQRYRERTDRALAAARRHPDTFLLIGYGRLTTQPETELARVCGFLGEAYDHPSLLGTDPDPERIAHWEQSSHLYGGIRSDTKRWQDFCTPAQAALIEEQLAEQMRRLGYDRYTG